MPADKPSPLVVSDFYHMDMHANACGSQLTDSIYLLCWCYFSLVRPSLVVLAAFTYTSSNVCHVAPPTSFFLFLYYSSPRMVGQVTQDTIPA